MLINTCTYAEGVNLVTCQVLSLYVYSIKSYKQTLIHFWKTLVYAFVISGKKEMFIFSFFVVKDAGSHVPTA